MAKKVTKTITVNETDINVGEIIKQGADAPLAAQIAVKTLLEDQIAQLKAVVEVMDSKIKGNPYEATVKKLIADGVLDSESETPVIEVHTKYGDKVRVTLSAGTDSGFEVLKELSDKAKLDDDIIPDKYKKRNVTLDKAALEADFTDGTLPIVLKGYCSVCPTEITKLRKTTVKEKEEK